MSLPAASPGVQKSFSFSPLRLVGVWDCVKPRPRFDVNFAGVYVSPYFEINRHRPSNKARRLCKSFGISYSRRASNQALRLLMSNPHAVGNPAPPPISGSAFLKLSRSRLVGIFARLVL